MPPKRPSRMELRLQAELDEHRHSSVNQVMAHLHVLASLQQGLSSIMQEISEAEREASGFLEAAAGRGQHCGAHGRVCSQIMALPVMQPEARVEEACHEETKEEEVASMEEEAEAEEEEEVAEKEEDSTYNDNTVDASVEDGEVASSTSVDAEIAEAEAADDIGTVDAEITKPDSADDDGMVDASTGLGVANTPPPHRPDAIPKARPTAMASAGEGEGSNKVFVATRQATATRPAETTMHTNSLQSKVLAARKAIGARMAIGARITARHELSSSDSAGARLNSLFADDSSSYGPHGPPPWRARSNNQPY